MAGASGGIKEIKSAASCSLIGRKISSVTLIPPPEVPEAAPHAACFGWGAMTAPVNAVSISRRPSLHLPFSRGCCCPEVPTALRTVPPTYVRPQLTLPHHDVTPRSTSQPSSFFFLLFLLYFPFTFLNPGLDKSRRLLRSFQPGHLARRPVSIATLQYRSDSDSHCRVEKEPKIPNNIERYRISSAKEASEN